MEIARGHCSGAHVGGNDGGGYRGCQGAEVAKEPRLLRRADWPEGGENSAVPTTSLLLMHS